MYGLVEN